MQPNFPSQQPGAAPQPGRMPGSLSDLPQGGVISTYDRHEDVHAAVKILAEADFPVQKLVVLSEGLRGVERIMGRLTFPRVAAQGAMQGSYFGLLFGVLQMFVLPAAANPLVLFTAALIIGAGFGMLLRVLLFAVNRNRPVVASMVQTVAERYELCTEPQLVHEARQILSGGVGG